VRVRNAGAQKLAGTCTKLHQDPLYVTYHLYESSSKAILAYFGPSKLLRCVVPKARRGVASPHGEPIPTS
jgi:hypothetical protein